MPSVARYDVVSCSEISVLVVEPDVPQDKVAAFVEKGVDVRFSGGDDPGIEVLRIPR
jgi:hypothetical protein